MAQELPKHKWEQDPEPNAFMKEEKEAIIQAFKTHQGNWNNKGKTGFKYSHYAPLVQFWFLTGCRPSEGIGLTWGQINDDCTQIVFNQALVQLAGGKIVKSEGSKNHRYKKSRKFLCTETLQFLLFSIKPNNPSPDSLVFPSPKGKAINYANFCKRGWNKLVDPIVKRNTTPYSCRDTFMSEQIGKGIAPEIIARWCDSSADTIRKHYLDDKILEHLRPIE
jgi:integrase